MNPNSPSPGHLFFTPRTPWGTRAGQQSFRHHQRASEDKKPDPASKEMQGLGGQMAPSQLTGSGGQPAKTDSSVWKVPHSNLQPYQSQPTPKPPAPTAQQLATQGPLASTQQQWRFAQPASFPREEGEKHWSGSVSGDGVRRPKDGPDQTQAVIQYSTHPSVKDADNRRQQQGRPSPRTPERIDEQEDDEARNPEGDDED